MRKNFAIIQFKENKINPSVDTLKALKKQKKNETNSLTWLKKFSFEIMSNKIEDMLKYQWYEHIVALPGSQTVRLHDLLAVQV